MAISDTVRGGKACDDVRYYILSKRMSARRFGAAVRGHWGIENSLHWQMDMSFGEDRSRVRKGHADANLALVRRTALSLLKNEKSQKVGVKAKRLTAGWKALSHGISSIADSFSRNCSGASLRNSPKLRSGISRPSRPYGV
jgi:predicted transposase YbfD/YdcC